MGSAEEIRELVGIYDADGTPIGELRYLIGRQLGRAHCSLCDVTHGALRERADWRAVRASLPVRFAAIHRNDCSSEQRSHAGRLPAVLAMLGDGSTRLLLDADDIEGAAGVPANLADAIRRRAERMQLTWPADGSGRSGVPLPPQV